MPKSNSDRPPHLELVKDLMKTIYSYCKANKASVTGNVVIERPNDTPVVLAYGSYTAGQVCWFGDAGKIHLYTIVNDKVERVASALQDKTKELMTSAERIRKSLERKSK